MAAMRDALLPGGALLLSGFIHDDRSLMLEGVREAGLRPLEDEDDATERAVIDAINSDPRLTRARRRALIETYRAFMRWVSSRDDVVALERAGFDAVLAPAGRVSALVGTGVGLVLLASPDDRVAEPPRAQGGQREEGQKAASLPVKNSPTASATLPRPRGEAEPTAWTTPRMSCWTSA